MTQERKNLDIKGFFFSESNILFEPLTSFDLSDLANPVDFFIIFIRLFIFIRIVVKFHLHPYFLVQNIIFKVALKFL